ncbi:siphovirus ReqiPepy6 Gp37-like family protein [Streptomyces olivaceus]|uniref:siphovirus ReqiPepy6 Gp37-like family protein n=1 Tax=Streptomyces olivaceus TaxID=47716 RepID=UPI001CCCC22F|nr:siphovirus ReqiPepy6 Gp37-like family protein [Streptomyces olivaceus]MBZ6259768.1 siphovirus ReqiPepy6 Gp37-like family protein [Streptomyces olivaceus]
MTVQLLVTDRNLNFVGDPITGWTKLTCDLNFNAPASGSVELPAWPSVMEQLQPGNRMVVIRDKKIWCAGPMEFPQDPYSWDLGTNASPGTVTVRFSDDLARIAGYVTYPEPSKTFAAQTTTSDVKRKIVASTAEETIRTLVNENCGPGALPARRIERLVLDTIADVGTAQVLATRFEPLLDICRKAAITNRLGFRTRQVGDEIRFGVYEPRDLTKTVRFSDGLGNLRSVQSTLGAPTATSELVMGGTDPAEDSPEGDPAYERVYVEVTSNQHVDWWRAEKFVEKSGVDDDSEGELTQAGVLAFGNDNPTASLSTVTVDTPDLKAGRDFGLGDLVAVVLPTGLEIADVVQSIGLAAEPDSGELVTTVIGNNDRTTTTRLVWLVRDLAYRLGQMEGRG